MKMEFVYTADRLKRVTIDHVCETSNYRFRYLKGKSIDLDI